MSCWIPGTGGIWRDIEYRTTMTAPGTKPLTVRWTTSTLAVNVTFVVVTDPPFPYGWVAEARSTDKAVMFNDSGALLCHSRTWLNGTAAQIDPAAAATIAPIKLNAPSDLRSMRSPIRIIETRRLQAAGGTRHPPTQQIPPNCRGPRSRPPRPRRPVSGGRGRPGSGRARAPARRTRWGIGRRPTLSRRGDPRRRAVPAATLFAAFLTG
jgi:hypothetical protein